ncbi:unnamed protein product [Moneuplotes crassus]|uniref:Uncharacterized protein n=1 Tax=Euplotes crassus TaxID=5936 RepID=A0AAD1X537_EUPCR|nr:unnamed protein product [Moneuplotes crassus]
MSISEQGSSTITSKQEIKNGTKVANPDIVLDSFDFRINPVIIRTNRHTQNMCNKSGRNKFQSKSISKSRSKSKKKIFKSGGHFKLQGRVINEDQYFDEAYKTNILLARRLRAIDTRKPKIPFKRKPVKINSLLRKRSVIKVSKPSKSLKNIKKLQSARHSRRMIAKLTVYPSEPALNKQVNIEKQNQTINFFPKCDSNNLQPNYLKTFERNTLSTSRKGSGRFYLPKSSGASENTSQTMDTKIRKREGSSNSRPEKLTKKRLFNYRFFRKQNKSLDYSIQLKSLQKTVQHLREANKVDM